MKKNSVLISHATNVAAILLLLALHGATAHAAPAKKAEVVAESGSPAAKPGFFKRIASAVTGKPAAPKREAAQPAPAVKPAARKPAASKPTTKLARKQEAYGPPGDTAQAKPGFFKRLIGKGDPAPTAPEKAPEKATAKAPEKAIAKAKPAPTKTPEATEMARPGFFARLTGAGQKPTPTQAAPAPDMAKNEPSRGEVPQEPKKPGIFARITGIGANPALREPESTPARIAKNAPDGISEPVAKKPGFFARLTGRGGEATDSDTQSKSLPPSIPGQASLLTRLTSKPHKPSLADAPEAKQGWLARLTQPVTNDEDDVPVAPASRKVMPSNWKDMSIVREDGLKFYEFGPSQAQGADMRLNRGTVLEVRKVMRGYAFVEIEKGRTGYVDASLLRKASKDDFREAPSSSRYLAGMTKVQMQAAQASAAAWAPLAQPPDLPDGPLPSRTEMDAALMLLPPLEPPTEASRASRPVAPAPSAPAPEAPAPEPAAVSPPMELPVVPEAAAPDSPAPVETPTPAEAPVSPANQTEVPVPAAP